MADEDFEGRIDLDAIIASKFKGKKLPGFVVRFFKRFVHQDWMNSILARGYKGADFCDDTLSLMDIQIEVEGLENVPRDGTLYTFASNHPLGGVDGLALCSLITRQFGPMKMLVNDFLLFIRPIEPLCVPINKIGGQARNLPALVDEAFASEDQMIMFPAGSCSRKIDGKIQDRPWAKTFIQKSAPNGRRVVPIHFIGRNSNRFYRVDRICKLLGIKFNLAMLFLPDELYRGQHSRYKVIIGEPFPLDAFDSSRTAAEWAQWVREKVYELE